jgi:pyruvate/2-oxoglutarate dehydrogenase complex dihydrolipoamide acyltransferase (E2) component
MPTQIVLPKLGFSMVEAVFSAWIVPDGGSVVEGQPLYSIESDKSVEEIEAPASGTVKAFAEPGVTYVVGFVLGEII